MRTFISINLDDDTKKKILQIQSEVKHRIQKINDRYLNSIKWEALDKFHLTLFFIGEVNDDLIHNIDLQLQNVKNDLTLGKINFEGNELNAFPKLRYPRVVILELSENEGKVLKLYDKITEQLTKLGFTVDKKFHPHITLGRVRRDVKINLSSLEIDFEPQVKFSVNSFYLMKSELKSTGSEYSVIKKYELI